MADVMVTGTPGRSCPLHYRYRPEQLVADPETVLCGGLLIAGGLYGNPYALTVLEQRLLREPELQAVFNGDFHWFDTDPDVFADVTRRVLRHRAIQGNVELEVAQPSDGAGCGCAYPETVSADVVNRSNRIMASLQRTLNVCDREVRGQLLALPRWRCLHWQGLRVLILHGDPESLAGWGLAREALADPKHQATLARWFRQTDADIIACTHTCEPALWQQTIDGRLRTVINNGAAGMGNLHEDHRGLVTRLALSASHDAVASGHIPEGVVELVPVDFSLTSWLAQFRRDWPEGSPARLSYEGRISRGTALAATDIPVTSSVLASDDAWRTK